VILLNKLFFFLVDLNNIFYTFANLQTLNFFSMENVLQAGVFGPWQVVLIVLAILLLFGGKKLPELMKGMGKGIKGFKDELNGGESKDSEAKKNIEE